MTTYTSLYVVTASIALDYSLVVKEVLYDKILCRIKKFIKNSESNCLSNADTCITVSLFHFLSALTAMSPVYQQLVL